MGNSVRSAPAPPERPPPCSDGMESDFLAVLTDYPSPDISPPIFRRGEKLRVISDEGGWWKAISLSTGRENYIPGICVARVYHGWLFEGLGRDKAEELLQLPDTKIGSFMIRESETKKGERPPTHLPALRSGKRAWLLAASFGARLPFPPPTKHADRAEAVSSLQLTHRGEASTEARGLDTGFYSLSVRHRQVKHYRIFRLPNNWYYISPRLTFQCLEDLVNHYSEVADGLCCVLTTPCLTQSTAAPAVRASDSPVTLRQKTLDWRKMSRLQEDPEGAGSPLGVDQSLFSYGLRESIASYLSLTGEDSAPLDRKKKSISLLYSGSKRKSAFFSSPPYFED